MAKALVFAAIFAVGRMASAGTVWIDTDVGIGSPIREVDDAYGLVFAFHSPELRIAGISASYGNAPLAHTTKMAREMAQRFGPDGVRVFAGANSPGDLRRPTEASAALANVLARNSVTYIALGPLTNLATFIELNPAMASRINRIIFVGGQLEGNALTVGPNGRFHIHDANVFKDPIAAELVLRSKIPMTLVPIVTAAKLTVTEEDLRQFNRPGTAAEYLASRSKPWLWFWTRIVKENGGSIFDALAVAAAARPELITTDNRFARMESGNLIAIDQRAPGRSVRACTRFDPKLKRVLVERISEP